MRHAGIRGLRCCDCPDDTPVWAWGARGLPRLKLGQANEAHVAGAKRKKTLENVVFPRVSDSDADGTRTRNLRIDSPEL